jgi:hypothetical protein
MSKEQPNPGVGGSYLFDPESGELTLITKTPTPKDNGTNSEGIPPSGGGVDVRD